LRPPTRILGVTTLAVMGALLIVLGLCGIGASYYAGQRGTNESSAPAVPSPTSRAQGARGVQPHPSANAGEVAGGAAAVPVGAGPTTEDIVGLRIGMTPEEVRRQLQGLNPNFKIAESLDQSRNARFMSAGVPGEVIVLEFTETQPRAFFIGRSIGFPPGQRPTKENLNKDLIAKYGRPSSEDTGRPWGDAFSWSRSSPKPNQATNPYGLRGCAPMPSGGSQWSAGAGTSPIWLRATTPECDKLIEASVGSAFNEDPRIAATLGVSITDFSLARSDPRHPGNVAADADRRRIEEAQKTKSKL